MPNPGQHRIRIGEVALDLTREVLTGADGPVVSLRPRAWLVVKLLARQAGRVASKDESMNEVWSDCVVTEDSLVQAIGDVRRALGEARRTAPRTMPRRGYMLVTADAPVNASLAKSRSAASRAIG